LLPANPENCFLKGGKAVEGLRKIGVHTFAGYPPPVCNPGVAVPHVPSPTIIDHIVAGRTEFWFHEGQRNEKGGVRGRIVWRYLMEYREVLENCVRVSELRAIQSEGLDFFRHFFFGMVVLGVSLDDYWPCIYEKMRKKRF